MNCFFESVKQWTMPSRVALCLVFVLCLGADGVTAEPLVGAIDARLKLANLQNAAIAEQEAEVRAAEAAVVQALDAAIARLDVSKVERVFGTLAAFRPFVKDLRDQGSRILAFEEAYAKSLKELQVVLRDSPDTFEQAERIYSQYAQEESFPSIADDYRGLAKSFSALAKRVKERHSEVAEEEQEIASVMLYVQRENLFLSRFEAFLLALPENPGGDDRERFLEQLKRYAQGMEKLREAMKSFNSRMEPTSQRSSPPPAQPYTPNPVSDPFSSPFETRPSAPIAPVTPLRVGVSDPFAAGPYDPFASEPTKPSVAQTSIAPVTPLLVGVSDPFAAGPFDPFASEQSKPSVAQTSMAPAVTRLDGSGSSGFVSDAGLHLKVGQRIDFKSPRGTVTGTAVVMAHANGEYRVRSVSGGAILTGDTLLVQRDVATRKVAQSRK